MIFFFYKFINMLYALMLFENAVFVKLMLMKDLHSPLGN